MRSYESKDSCTPETRGRWGGKGARAKSRERRCVLRNEHSYQLVAS